MGTSTDLLECWRLNNAINLRLIDAISDAGMKSTMSTRGEGIGRWIATALGYFLAHDAHHRGNILLTLKLSGHKVDTKIQYGIWMMWHNKKA